MKTKLTRESILGWARDLRNKFCLPVPKGKTDSEWWDGYEAYITDLERHVGRTEPDDAETARNERKGAQP